MNALWIAAALLVAGFVGWPVTALVFRLARTIDDKADAATATDDAERKAAEDPSADVTVDTVAGVPAGAGGAGQAVDGELTAEPGQPSSSGSSQPSGVSGKRILRGGAIIGILERLAVCLAILTGQPVAIAYVVAIKGLGRFAELKETPVAAERFIIGTLTSMLWAAGIAAIVKVLFLH
ncbi:hypothetical protein QFZ30_002691 [Arthrobacter pascens]|uniref:hypothetical protein n=1 Tax=Arthrobacter pascens TaxID=1677 RepID=UPI002791E0FB|nr:hypothetical protein [Arthrobacter pascens]MDQ0679309.1 hypothetical protein [Arthrobacter pascens]